jgi:hypothetical protein
MQICKYVINGYRCSRWRYEDKENKKWEHEKCIGISCPGYKIELPKKTFLTR